MTTITWSSYKTELKTVLFADTITCFPANAFDGHVNLTSVRLPTALESLLYHAFYDCSALEALTIPDGVTSIKSGAFASCPARLYATAGSSAAQELSREGFYFCLAGYDNVRLQYSFDANTGSITGLKAKAANNTISSVQIPAGVTLISVQAFLGSPVRLFARIGSNAASVICEAGKYFYTPGNGNDKLKYSITDGTITGLKATRYDTAIETAVIPAGVTEFEASAFSGCANLTSVSLPEGLGAIPSEAFKDCAKLASLTLPASVTGIGGSAFSGCTALGSLTLPDGLERLGSNYWFYVAGNVSVRLRRGACDRPARARGVTDGRAADPNPYCEVESQRLRFHLVSFRPPRIIG